MGKRIYINQEEFETIVNAVDEFEDNYDSAIDEEHLAWMRAQAGNLKSIIKKYKNSKQ